MTTLMYLVAGITMKDVLDKLKGGDRRSIGRVEEVVSDVMEDPSLFEPLFNGMMGEDPLVRIRSADAVEKITERHPEYLEPYKKKIIRTLSKIDQQEVRWHLAQMFPRLRLTSRERDILVDILLEFLKDKSTIVQVFSMQALADFAEQDENLRGRVIALIKDLTLKGSAAVKSRGRKLLKKLGKDV